ncbi:MAG: sulfur carrier protein ThiS [Deltaproteobacteria bacterium]|nr:sulfur carrier protein ThiS [Deltaproteobacteria bacterium]MBW2678798.1 sulfur carrier protein ThiS [Deltaproteobacteria bacterium]
MISLNDEKIPWQEGMTVADLLSGLNDAHNYAVIRVNGKYVSRPNFDAYKIPDEAEIFLIPMVVGG